jgi:hypothetical protein
MTGACEAVIDAHVHVSAPNSDLQVVASHRRNLCARGDGELVTITATGNQLRPPHHRLNALDADLFAALPEVFGRLADDEDTRVVILTGAGSAFCAGADFAHHGITATDVAGLTDWVDSTGCRNAQR